MHRINGQKTGRWSDAWKLEQPHPVSYPVSPRNGRVVVNYRPMQTCYIAVKLCHRYDLSPSYNIVTELTCHRFNCHQYGLSPIWPVSLYRNISSISYRISISYRNPERRSITIVEALLILYSILTVFVYIAYNNRRYYYCY